VTDVELVFIRSELAYPAQDLRVENLSYHSVSNGRDERLSFRRIVSAAVRTLAWRLEVVEPVCNRALREGMLPHSSILRQPRIVDVEEVTSEDQLTDIAKGIVTER